MPTYDFICTECDNSDSRKLSFDELNQEHLCWRCGALLRRVISKPGIVFRGTGWGRDGK